MHCVWREAGDTIIQPHHQPLQPGTPLEIDFFFISDPDGHLDDYSMVVKYGLSSEKNLLSTADVGSFGYIAAPGALSDRTIRTPLRRR
jgi:hypothetical protein